MKQTNKKGFTLIEILVVVLIIGILAAIAVPQYKKAVAKADLHKGVSLVESIYQAQQAYYLAHGDYAIDIDDLDVSIPKDSSCTKTQVTGASFYKCDYGAIGFWDGIANVQYQTKDGNLGYLHFLKDMTIFEAGKRYCYADSATAAEVCKNLGGEKINDGNGGWRFGLYKLQ